MCVCVLTRGGVDHNAGVEFQLNGNTPLDVVAYQLVI